METRSIFDKARIVVAKDMTDVNVVFLLGSLYKKSRLTFTHSVNVGYLMAQICIANKIPKYEAEQIVKGALLHDIGKLNIPVEIINKKGKLTEEEYNIIKTHTTEGVAILKNIAPTLSSDIILDIIENHHESPDGHGYAQKKELSYYSQLVRAVDIYDALTSDRPYRTAYSMSESIKIMSDEGIANSYIETIQQCKIK